MKAALGWIAVILFTLVIGIIIGIDVLIEKATGESVINL